jgi:hypothetical protein
VLHCLDALVEERILAAQARGEFDDLPGAGRPLDLEDDALIPAELRLAYRILKNAGYAPPEVAVRREIGQLAALVIGIVEGGERMRALKRLELLRLRLVAMRRDDAPLQLDGAYYDKLASRRRTIARSRARGRQAL